MTTIRSTKHEETLLDSMLASTLDVDNQNGDLARASSLLDRHPHLLELARAHGVDVILHDALERSQPAGHKAPILKCLDERRKFEALATSHFRAVLQEVLAKLAADRVPAIALKGLVFGERYYPPRAPRPATDIDLLFEPADLERAVESLAQIGYHSTTSPARELARTHAHHVDLERAGSPAVEAHFRLHSEFGADIPTAPFFARSVTYRTHSGSEVRVLSVEDEVLYLALHAAAHRLIRLGWLYDIALIITKNPNLDWGLIETRARALGLHSAASFALDAVADRLRVPVPRAMRPKPGAMRARVAHLLCSSYATRESSIPVQRATSFAFATILCDDPAQSARSMKHLVLRFGERQVRAIFR